MNKDALPRRPQPPSSKNSAASGPFVNPPKSMQDEVIKLRSENKLLHQKQHAKTVSVNFRYPLAFNETNVVILE